MKKLFTITCLIAFLFSIESKAQSLFLKIQIQRGGDTIDGGSTSRNHPNEIEVNNFQDGTGASCELDGSCAPAAQTSLKLTLPMDISYVNLQKALLTHEVLNVTLARQIATQTTEYDNLLIYLEDAVINGITTNSDGENPTITMTISAPIWHRTFKLSSGPSPAPIKYGWDFILNRPFTK